MRPWLVVYISDRMTLVRGKDGYSALTRLGHRPVWSPSGGGWVVRGTEVVHDLQALANLDHRFIAISRRGSA